MDDDGSKYEIGFLRQLHDPLKVKNGSPPNDDQSPSGKKKRDRFSPTPCPFCDLVLTRKDGLPRHIQKKHPNEYEGWINLRDILNPVKNTVNNLNNSEVLAAEDPLDISNDDFEENENVENEMMVGDIPLEVNISESPVKNKYRPGPAQCPYCKETVSRKDNLKPHILRRHPGMAVVETASTPTKTSTKKTPNVKAKCSTKFIPSPVNIERLKKTAEIKEQTKKSISNGSPAAAVAPKKNSKPIPPLTPIVNNTEPKKGKHTPTPTPCPYCGQVMSRRDSVKPHIIAKHPGQPVPANICSIPTPTEKQMKQGRIKESAREALMESLTNGDNQEEFIDEDQENSMDYVEVDYDSCVEPEMVVPITELTTDSDYEEGEVRGDYIDYSQPDTVTLEIVSSRSAIQCPFCDRYLSRKEWLVKHVKSAHKGKKVEFIHIKKDKLTGENIEEINYESDAYDSDVKVEEDDVIEYDNDEEVTSIEIENSKVPVQCPFCNVVISRKNNFVKHVQRLHPGKRIEIIQSNMANRKVSIEPSTEVLIEQADEYADHHIFGQTEYDDPIEDMEPLQEMVEIDEVVSIEIASARTPAACPFCGQMLSRKEQLIKHVNSKHPGKRVEVISQASANHSPSKKAKPDATLNGEEFYDHQPQEVHPGYYEMEANDTEDEIYNEADEITEVTPEEIAAGPPVIDDSGIVTVVVENARSPVGCPFCDRMLTRKENLMKHVERWHENQQINVIMRSSLSQKEKSLYSSPQIIVPKKLVKVEPKAEPSPAAPAGDKPKSKYKHVRCPYCQLILTRYANLKGHIYSKHKGSEVPELNSDIIVENPEELYQQQQAAKLLQSKEIKPEPHTPQEKSVLPKIFKTESLAQPTKKIKTESQSPPGKEAKEDWERVWKDNQSVHVKFNFLRGKTKGKEKPRKNSETSCSVSLESLDDDSILADELEIKQEFQETNPTMSHLLQTPTKSSKIGNKRAREEDESLKLTKLRLSINRKPEKPVDIPKVPSPGTPGIIDLHRQSIETFGLDSCPEKIQLINLIMGGEEPLEATIDAEINVISKIEEKVNGVYHYRDHYFEDHDISEALHKGARLKERTQGRLLNVEPDYSQQAEEVLSKAVKLNPGLVQAWNELGESYTRKYDFINARICFEGALQQERNKVSLRSLSMVLRQLSTKSAEEKVMNIEKSLVKGKDAVSLDTTDGMSWSILGNAFFAHFFMVSQNPKTLKQAMSAYSQADKDTVSRSTPELHYNKGIALKYEEMYENAIGSFSTAQKLDPTWDGPKIQEENLLNYLDKIVSLMKIKGQLKPRKINSMLEGLENKNLGPYSGGSYTSPKGHKALLNHVKFKDLRPGLNNEQVILGSVICSVHSEETVPFTFQIMDKDESILVVTLYNLSPGKGVIIGDSVAIAEPYLTNINFKYKDKQYQFGLVRVESPLVLVINGKKAGRDLQAGVQMTTFTKS